MKLLDITSIDIIRFQTIRYPLSSDIINRSYHGNYLFISLYDIRQFIVSTSSADTNLSYWVGVIPHFLDLLMLSAELGFAFATVSVIFSSLNSGFSSPPNSYLDLVVCLLIIGRSVGIFSDSTRSVSWVPFL